MYASPSVEATVPPSRKLQHLLRICTRGAPMRAVGPLRRLAQVQYRNSFALVIPT
jgi:hypothetical protein